MDTLDSGDTFLDRKRGEQTTSFADEPCDCSNSERDSVDSQTQTEVENSLQFGFGCERAGTLFDELNEMRREKKMLQLRRPSVLPVELSAERFFAAESTWTNVAKNPFFEGCTLFVVALNAVWIGIDTDHNRAPDPFSAKMEFILMENFFCFYFTFEVLIRFLAFEHKVNCIKDFWFKFDSFLVALMVFETWVIPLIFRDQDKSVARLSILRLLRLLRLSRMARLMRALPSLVILLKGMKAATRSVVTTLVLLMIILYVFGMIFTMQIGDDPEHHEKFGTLPLSMYNLFLGATLLDNCTELFRSFKDSKSTTSIVMLCAMFLFVLISSFTVLNMLIGVLWEVASATKNSETNLADWSVASHRLTMAFREIDEDKTGTVSKKEFIRMAEKEEVLTAFEILNVEPKDLLGLSDALFESQSDGEEEKELSFSEFLDLVWNSKPGTLASTLDIRRFLTTLRQSAMRECQIIDRLYHCVKDEIPAVDENVLEQELERKLDATRKRAEQLQRDLQELKEKEMSTNEGNQPWQTAGGSERDDRPYTGSPCVSEPLCTEHFW